MRINAILTFYNPSSEAVQNIFTYLDQVDRVFVCDNSPSENKELFKKIDKVSYIHFGDNLGISSAINNVLKDHKNEWSDEDYVIFFDQDSSVTKSHILKLINSFKFLENRGVKIGAIGPVYSNSSNNRVEGRNRIHNQERFIEVSEMITSSMLTKYKILKKVNFFNPNVFLDYSDWDLCWRIGIKGYRCIIDREVVLNHQVGLGEKRFFGVRVREWNPIRTYYQIRDGRYLSLQNYVPLKKRIQLFYMSFCLPILNILLFGNKQLRVELIKKGNADYKNGLIGEMNSNRRRISDIDNYSGF